MTIRAEAAKAAARQILEAAAPAVVTDTLVELTATLIIKAVETDEIRVGNEELLRRLEAPHV